MLGNCAYCDCNRMCGRQGRSCVPVEKEAVLNLYSEDERKIMEAAAYVEATYYMKYTRLQETAAFAEKMGYKKIGIGFCMGICEEAKLFADYFIKQGFDVYSVMCKNTGIDKDELGLKKVDPESAAECMCNPKGQAEFLNEKGCELFVSAGLCVGHDALFAKACQGPVTTLVVKDRVLANNPIGVVYSGYWKGKLGLK